MASVSQLGYLGLSVSDVAAWERFATQILGLALSERGADGSLLLRMDDYHYRFAVHPQGNDDVAYIGWEVADAGMLRALAHQLEAAGVAVTQGTEADAQARRVVELIKFRDPNGVASEVFYGPLIAADGFKSPRGISGFETGDMGLGHTIIVADDFDETIRFYTEVLGMRVSDFITGLQMHPEAGTTLGFLHCNPRHHTLATYEQPRPPKRLNHFMIELKSLDDVGSTYYLCQQERLPIVLTLGRHTNDRMLSFYVGTPSGFMVEYGWGGRRVDDSTWQVQLHTSGSVWGHRLGGLEK